MQAAEVTTREIDVAVHDLLGAALDRACDVLQKRELISTRRRASAHAETLTADDSPAILSAKRQWSDVRQAELPRRP